MRRPDPVSPASRQPGHNLLVVDGDVLSRLVIAEYLRKCGYRVREAADFGEAKQALEASHVQTDVVLFDVHTPGGTTDGFALARWIREHHPDVKVILSSGAEWSAEIAGRLCESGPRLKKPYDPQHTVRRIKQLLAKNAPHSGPNN
jgi:DNA-binding response OmpR family regulator